MIEIVADLRGVDVDPVRRGDAEMLGEFL
jgi:hypothetical protein